MIRTVILCRLLLRRNTRALATSAGPSVEDVRDAFLQFFLQRDHVHVPSSSVVPTNDDSLLFTSAGMNQFKQILTGQVAPKYPRVVNWQRCLRTSDLEVVGHDHHHHTFFEMLGNWSFNKAYFKREACENAWEFLTERVKISPERIYVSYFGGSKKLGIGPDTECLEIWKKIGYVVFAEEGSSSVPEDRILPFESENFWDMGETGPCGPSTELHVDRVASRRGAQDLVNRGDDSLVEVWNLVFIAHNREADGSLSGLPSAHVDTGMGLERLVSILQNVSSNYDTDAFRPIFAQIEALGGPKYTASSSPTDVSLRIIADHLRGFCVALADGVSPSGQGRGFIVTRLLRGAFRHMRFIGLPQGSSGPLVDTAFDLLVPAYPSFRDAHQNVRKMVMIEEISYAAQTKQREELLSQVRSSLPDDCRVIPGDLAMYLHQKHGVPIEDLESLARANGMEVDMAAFEELLEDDQELSKSDKKDRRDTA